MSRVPWPLPPVAPPGTPGIFGVPKFPDDQYGAPGTSPQSGLSLPAHAAFTHVPNGLGPARSQSPTFAKAPPRVVPSFFNPAEFQLQDLKSPFAQIATTFSYTRNDRSTTGGAPGSEDLTVYSGVPSFVELNSFRVDGGRPSPKVEERDLIHFVSNLRGLVTQAEHSVNRILDLVKLKLDISGNSYGFSPSSNLNPLPNEVMFHHSILQKTMNSAGQTDNSSSRTVATEVFSPKKMECTSIAKVSTMTKVAGDGEDVNEESTRIRILESALELGGSPKDLLKNSKVLKEMIKYLNYHCGFPDNFFYEGAPAVVHVPAHPVPDDLALPGFAVEERWAEFATWMEFETPVISGDECKSLLPSRYWLLKKELGSWKGVPLHYTSTHLEAAVALARLKRTDLRKSLLAILPYFGVVLDKHLVNHILLLLIFCLRAVHREAVMVSSRINIPESSDLERHFNDGKDSAVGVDRNSLPNTGKDASRNVSTLQGKVSVKTPNVFESRALLESSGWLASQLSPLYGVGSSKNLVLCLYAQALEHAAYSIAFSDLRSGSDASLDALHKGKISRERRVLDGDAMHQARSSGFVLVDGGPAEPKGGGVASSGCGTLEGSGLFSEVNGDRRLADDVTLCDGTLSLWQIAAAIAAIQRRACHEQHREDEHPFLHLSQIQRSSIHDSILKLAEEERGKRENYRAVLEHDGLVWQRQQSQNNKKFKTKEEILADERDYKRRRMSYRGKKVQRTPSQVLHDIIEGHMEEIIAAGGIGCFGRRLQELSALQMETERSRHLPLQDSYCRDDVFADEQRPAAYRKYLHSSDGDVTGSKEHSHLQETSSSEVRERRSNASHLESSKHSKYRTPDKYEHKSVDEKHRQSVGRSVSSSYRSFHHDQDKLDLPGERWRDWHERSHYDSREHDSVRQFDRWESKLDEKDEFRYHGKQHHSRHCSSSEVEKDGYRGLREERYEYKGSHGRDTDKRRRSHGKDTDGHRKSYDEKYYSRHHSEDN